MHPFRILTGTLGIALLASACNAAPPPDAPGPSPSAPGKDKPARPPLALPLRRQDEHTQDERQHGDAALQPEAEVEAAEVDA